MSSERDCQSVEILFITLTDITMPPSDLPKLRGYLAGRYPWLTPLHNHLPGGRFSYRFPLIHYRLRNGHPTLMGIGEGIEIILGLFGELDKVVIGQVMYPFCNCSIELKQYPLGVADAPRTYRFISPWMALNQDNFAAYLRNDPAENQGLLNHILRENLKTISKGTGYAIPDIDKVKVEGLFSPRTVNFKNKKMVAFTGTFSINFHIPDFFALGKQGARGFGVVQATG